MGNKPLKAGGPGGQRAVEAKADIPRVSMLLDDLAHDLSRSSGGRGVAERHADGSWSVKNAAILCPDSRNARVTEQAVVDTFGTYGALWSSPIRPGIAFAVRISSAELVSLQEGIYMVGLTPFSVFSPITLPSDESWLPHLLLTARGDVSARGKLQSLGPWTTPSVDVGFLVRSGVAPGLIRVSVYVNNTPVLEDVDMKLPRDDSLHLFVFLNFVGDTVQVAPNWKPPRLPDGAAGLKGGKGKGSRGGGQPAGQRYP
ncbi:hypothetical protein DIPPA_11142 [Diplonema papillatum]|nr:hypothetical protein DIPPA_11142 [Diplonema papillatum]